MKKTRQTLETICELFNLGTLRNWTSTTEIVGGLKTIYFTTVGSSEQFTYYEPINN